MGGRLGNGVGAAEELRMPWQWEWATWYFKKLPLQALKKRELGACCRRLTREDSVTFGRRMKEGEVKNGAGVLGEKTQGEQPPSQGQGLAGAVCLR